MSVISVKINQASISKKIEAAFKEKSGQIARTKAYNLFKRAKGMMLKDFDQHPVTLEILAGNRAINFSNTLEGYGNLFSFLGFEAGSDPTTPLRDLLETTNFRETTFRNLAWYFRISLPSKEEIRKATPMDWEIGNSWAEGIEDGLSNLSYFLFKRSNVSRSGTGFQTPFEINDDLTFKRTKYLSEILGNFRNRINNSTVNNI